MFSFWSSTLQNIYTHVHTRKRKETQTNRLYKLNSLSAFFCFQMIILVLSLEHALPWTGTLHRPQQLLLEGLGSFPSYMGRGGLMQMRTGCSDVTLWKCSESTVTASEEKLHHKVNLGSSHLCWTDLTQEYFVRKSLKQDFSFTLFPRQEVKCAETKEYSPSLALRSTAHHYFRFDFIFLFDLKKIPNQTWQISLKPQFL